MGYYTSGTYAKLVSPDVHTGDITTTCNFANSRGWTLVYKIAGHYNLASTGAVSRASEARVVPAEKAPLAVRTAVRSLRMQQDEARKKQERHRALEDEARGRAEQRAHTIGRVAVAPLHRRTVRDAVRRPESTRGRFPCRPGRTGCPTDVPQSMDPYTGRIL